MRNEIKDAVVDVMSDMFARNEKNIKFQVTKEVSERFNANPEDVQAIVEIVYEDFVESYS